MCPVIVDCIKHSNYVEDNSIVHSEHLVSLSHCAGHDDQQEEQTDKPICEQIQASIGFSARWSMMEC